MFSTEWFLLGMVLAPISYSGTVGYFQNKYPKMAEEELSADRLMGFFFAVMTAFLPFIFLIPLFNTNFFERGFKW